jgi:hypothetical protein
MTLIFSKFHIAVIFLSLFLLMAAKEIKNLFHKAMRHACQRQIILFFWWKQKKGNIL